MGTIPMALGGKIKMWKYNKYLQYPIHIKKKDLKMAKYLITQYGGPYGELGAALRYLNQRNTMPDDLGKATLTDIATEEFGHVEMISTMIYQLMQGATLEELEKEGYSVEVIDMFTIKPLDEKLLIKEAKGKSKIVTIENHSIYGGLGSAVSEVIAENGISVPVKRIGVKEKFGQVGTAEFLQEEFGLTAKQIKETICQF